MMKTFKKSMVSSFYQILQTGAGTEFFRIHRINSQLFLQSISLHEIDHIVYQEKQSHCFNVSCKKDFEFNNLDSIQRVC